MATPNQKEKRQKKRSFFAQSILTLFFTVASLATDGFGVTPKSQLSQDFRTLISESFPVEYILPFNQYLEELTLATIPLRTASDVAEPASPETEEISLAALLAEEMVEAMLAPEGLATPQPTDAQQTSTALPSPIPSTIPLLTATPIPTAKTIWGPWLPTKNRHPSCSNASHSGNQTTNVIGIFLSTLCSDPDGDTWAITSLTQGANGSTHHFQSDIFYTPNNGFAGTDSITFTIQDNRGGSYTQTLSVTLANLPPVANVDTSTVAKNSSTAISIPVLINDSDPGGDTFSITGTSLASAGGTITIIGTAIEYTPPAGFSGTDSFTYTIQDSHGGIDTDTVTVSVNNSPPTCSGMVTNNDQTLGSVPVPVVSFCSDPNGDTFTITAASSVNGYGTLTHNTTSHLYYDPDDGFAGTDQISFTLDDGDTSGTSSHTSTINISNLPPVTTTDAVNVLQNSSNTMFSVLPNDSDPGNDTFTITNRTHGTNGIVETDGTTVTYTPLTDFFGTDSFTYTVTDTHGGSATGTVNVTVTPTTTAILCDRAGSAGCIVNYTQFNGNMTDSIYVQPGETLLLEISADGWDTICPTCSYSFAFGIESTMLGCANPLTMSYISTGSNITASTVSGTYNIYANINENTCDYLNPSTSVAQVHVCAPVSMRVAMGNNCYQLPDSTSTVLATTANDTGFYTTTGKNNGTGTLFYEMYISPTLSCWVDEAIILEFQGDSVNCVP